jgi:hypothetical protein
MSIVPVTVAEQRRVLEYQDGILMALAETGMSGLTVTALMRVAGLLVRSVPLEYRPAVLAQAVQCVTHEAMRTDADV